jgi:hypothetical protein
MATTERHNKLVSFLIGEMFPLIKKKEVHVLHENCPLVYFGAKSSSTDFRLIDIKTVDNRERFFDNITEL